MATLSAGKPAAPCDAGARLVAESAPPKDPSSTSRLFATDALNWPPEYIHEQSAWLDHIPFAFWIVQALQPRCFVELGTYTGVSYLALCQAVRRLGLAAQGYAVDTWQGDEHSGYYGEEVYRTLLEYHESRYADFSRLVRSSFDEAVGHFEDGSIDLLHIDGLHTYEAVKHDYENWRPKLTAKSVVLFHDINVRERGFGVFRLWHELSKAHPAFEFLHGHGLGVLGIGSDFPPAIAALFAAGRDAATAASVRRQFAAFGAQPLVQRVKQLATENLRLVGATASLHVEAGQHRQQIAELKLEVQGLSGKLQERQRALTAMRHEGLIVEARDRQLDELRGQLGAQEAAAKQLAIANDHLVAQLHKLKRSLSWRLTRPLRAVVRLGRRAESRTRRGLSKGLRLACLPLRVPIRRVVLRQERLCVLSRLLPGKDRRLVEDIWLLRRSALFDKIWYLEDNPDVAEAGKDPVEHYVRTGARKGRNPGPAFDTKWYLAHNPDLAAKGVNPLAHFIRYGSAHDRSASPEGTIGAVPGAGNEPVVVADGIQQAFPALQPLRVYVVPNGPRRLTLVTDDGIDHNSLHDGGGTALILACLFAGRLGASLRVVSRRESPEQANFKQFLDVHGLRWEGNVDFRHLGILDGKAQLDLGEHDLFMTTSCWTTASVRQVVDPQRIFYLVQEDERLLYPSGDQKLLAQAVLADNQVTRLFDTNGVLDVLVQEGLGPSADQVLLFEPAFPRISYYPDLQEDKAKRNFVFYAQSRDPRHLYYRGLQAIDAAVQRGILSPEAWTIHLVGSDPGEVLLARGVRPTVHRHLSSSDYVALLRRMDAGLSLMASPHPGYPTLEFAACGAVVVTNQFGGKTSLSSYSANIHCVDGSVDALVGGIAAAVDVAADVGQRMANYENSRLSRDWAMSLGPVLDRLAAS